MIDIHTLGLRDLDRLVRAAEQRLDVLARRRPAAVVRQALIERAASYGYTIEAVFGTQAADPDVARKPARKRKAAKVAAKYRDPENRRNTWSGRGRMPRWLAERVRRGQSAADFLIPGLARPTARKNSPIGRKSVYKPR